MHTLAALGAWAWATLLPFTTLTFHSSLNISAQLGPQLSRGAAVFLPDDPGWYRATLRFQQLYAPTYQALVEVATEEDIQRTVRTSFWRIHNESEFLTYVTDSLRQ